ncbi:MAG: S41 family peptidase [Bacteroidales bacterium]|jgi:carboxyl-terminal processing protease|nr:S41 family peptidase [Bacteroidales bacterium]MDD4703392.1 S41 family peptidase [Bacteroidales bacterium]MDX9798256.1 S41 family peptidase [Bacteroidales bacterium]
MLRKSIVLLFLFVPFSFSLNAQEEDKGFELSKNLEIFSSVYKNLHLNYVDEINPGDLMKTAIDAMLAKLDPYTNFIPEANLEDAKLQLMGQYGGIGAVIHEKDGKVYISEPYQNLPADKAGFKAGDIILEVNGQVAKDRTSDEIKEFLRGQAGSEIKLKVLREGKEIEKTFRREEITIDNVPYYGIIRNEIGYIKLNEFTNGAANNVLNAFKELKKQNSDLKGLILDLRGNGGGLLTDAVSIVNMFVEKGQNIVSTKGKIVERNQTFKTNYNPIDLNIPIVILIDNLSASASEIVAGSLQDLDRAVIMGQRTFGKGLVQNIIPLTYNAQMKVTVSKYYIPSGRCIQAIDYSHRDEFGRALNVPDSLKVAFKTKGGRVVYDGFGIEPDVSIEPEYASPIIISIITKFLAFDFATEFVKQNPTIPSPKDFKITDEIYNQFTSFVKDKDYSYSTITERMLAELEDMAKKEKYSQEIENTIEYLKKKIEEDKNNDLIKFKDDIKEILLSEIVVRYHYQKGRIEALLNLDKDVAKAIELLSNSKEYNKILGK